uniref:Putative ovule protein n=1 Tax=Solanum chacoense TaxID=4108 RepID=A0A0V0GX53_SOLCH
MVLHDTFFVPPPKLDDASSDEQNELVTEADTAVDNDQATAAFKAIADVVSSQQLKEVPVQEELFSKAELLSEN